MNFLGLEITKTRKGFEVKNSTDLVESLLKLYGLQNSKPTVNPGRRSTVMELASATPPDGHDYRRKTHLHGTLETRHAIRHPTTIHTSPQPHDREQARSETVDTSKARNTLVFLNRDEMVQTGLLELVGRSDPDWASDSAQHARVLRDIRLSSCEAELVLRSQCLRRRTVGTRRTLQGTSLQSFSSSRNGLTLGKTHSAAPRTRRTQTH